MSLYIATSQVDKKADKYYNCQLDALNFEKGLIPMISQQLKQLRLAHGLSLEALASQMGGIVTKQALSKYEKGKARPTPVVLNRLASVLGVKTADLWREPNCQLQFIAYRKKSKLLKSEQEQIQSLVSEAIQKRIRLQQVTGQLRAQDVPIRKLYVESLEDVEEAAEAIRKRWDLGSEPISNVVTVLEDHHVYVLQVEAKEDFDGIAAVAHDDGQQILAAIVATRQGISGERQRLNLTHELGHLVLDVSQNLDEEKAAFRFGAALLAPEETIRREVGIKRTSFQDEELILLKRHFGMSIQALLYRLRDLSIITDTYYQQWCRKINRLGWRKEEPAELLPEQPEWFRRNILKAVSEDLISQEEGASMMNKTRESQIPFPSSLSQKRAFLQLPLEERRRLLEEQANNMVDEYQDNSERELWQGGDIVDY
ncbi:MAG: helix-turn-helix domain-containing protein [Chloroflexi bacterium AL-W]|nr:helix-turn-helix domain-containing protein [Chloroflexi bacterium AL-N1]NOK71056.1 helix-turn-helix domain-containing protein [Chloroflexi bacterium AL-N10]NOK72722.1 helix-turn-helix domain-containing protein [Chloroflexi bacterium AL-N5]NOK79190.1 helix-turn-helix domain-containing protein [Chloroflexi bacterium AL-W]NOK87106.1 helix-turn-helix domain-containing protein [Chloroflexi bacterium AL-N15]